MEGWWCVRFGNALACVEAPSEAAAVRRSLVLHPLGDWTDDARRLAAFPQDAYPDYAGPHDYTRAVLRADPPSFPGRRPQRRRGQSRFVLACLAGLLALGFVQGASAETWRGLTVGPEHRCAPYDKKRDYPYPRLAGAVHDALRDVASPRAHTVARNLETNTGRTTPGDQ